MVQIDLGQDTIFSVEINGQTYELREPTVEEVDKFRSIDATKDGASVVNQFLVNLGLPEEVLRKLTISKMKRLVDGLMSELTKKK